MGQLLIFFLKKGQLLVLLFYLFILLFVSTTLSSLNVALLMLRDLIMKSFQQQICILLYITKYVFYLNIHNEKSQRITY